MEGAIAHNLESGVIRTSDVAPGLISFGELQLKEFILGGLRAHKFQTPTKIQAAAIPMAVCGMNLLVQSKSGTGKTLIYVIAALQKWIKSVKKPQAIIIVPTRELAIQVEDTVNGLGNFQNERKICVSFIGGTDVKKDRMRIETGRIIVGTPGRLLHLLQNRVFDTSAIRLIVLDEADQLYATESLQKDINTLISPLLPKSQVIACSATYPNGLDDRLAKLMVQPILVSNSERATVLLGVRQFVYELPKQVNSLQDMVVKLDALRNIFGQLPYEQAILFASSQIRADSFCNYLRRANVECELMSGAVNQAKRLETFQAYRNFKMRTMVATDLMARGVDSPHANLIINLDPPADISTYLHRIGRAGRFGSQGIAITFISSPEQCEKFKHIIADIGTGTSVLKFPTENRGGYNFWNFDCYDFPYFHKSEGHEQDEKALQRIKKRWNTSEGTKETHVAHKIANNEINSNDNTSQMNLNETENPADVIIPQGIAVENVADSKIKEEQTADNTKKQTAAAEPINSLKIQLGAKKNDEHGVKPDSQYKKQNLAEEQLKFIKEQSLSKLLVAEKEDYLEENPPGVVQNDEPEVESEPQFEKDNLIEEQPKLIEERISDPLIAEKKNYLQENLIDEEQNIIKNKSNVLSESNTVDNKQDINDIQQDIPNDMNIQNSNQSQLDENKKALERQESVIELIEQTPSTEMPIAAPNSINTKTYCLAAPAELSSTTLHPLALSNTVDDASSIISDSMDSDDSDASYSSLYSESDARLIYCHALVQRKLQKRRERFSNRRIYFFNWRGCSPVSWNSSQTAKKAKSYMHESENTEIEFDIHQIQESEDDIMDTEELRRRSSRIKKLCKDDFNIKNYNLFTTKNNSALRVLEKFSNVCQIEKHFSNFIIKKNCVQLGDWINQLYNATLSLYYNKPKKARKIALPKVSNLDRYNSIMKILKDAEHGGETEQEYLQNKFSVHVNQPLNILPMNIDAESNDERAHSNASGTASSYNQSDDDDSLDPYSSSGFVDSTESASSGIDTSQNGNHSSVSLVSDEYSNEDDEADSIDNHTVADSINTLTGESEDGNEDETDSDDEEEHDESSDQTISLNNVDQRIVLAQERWQFLFHMQYQYIANYVKNYIDVCRRQQ